MKSILLFFYIILWWLDCLHLLKESHQIKKRTEVVWSFYKDVSKKSILLIFYIILWWLDCLYLLKESHQIKKRILINIVDHKFLAIFSHVLDHFLPSFQALKPSLHPKTHDRPETGQTLTNWATGRL